MFQREPCLVVSCSKYGDKPVAFFLFWVKYKHGKVTKSGSDFDYIVSPEGGLYQKVLLPWFCCFEFDPTTVGAPFPSLHSPYLFPAVKVDVLKLLIHLQEWLLNRR